MPLAHQEKETAARSKIAAPSKITHPYDPKAEQANPSTHGENLKRSFAAYGLSLHQLLADEMAVTGPEFPARMVPDMRAAHCLLRQLRGAQA